MMEITSAKSREMVVQEEETELDLMFSHQECYMNVTYLRHHILLIEGWGVLFKSLNKGAIDM